MRKWVFRVLIVTLALTLFLMGTTTVFAEPAADVPEADVAVQIDETGGWAVTLGGTDLGIDSANLTSLATRFGFAMPPLSIDASMVSMAMDNGIQSLALVKEAGETTVLINGVPTTALTITDAAVKKLADAFVPELEGLLAWVNSTDITLVAEFPVAPGVEPFALNLDQKVPVPEAEEYANVISLGATLSPEGKLVSVAGLPADQVGMAMTLIDPFWLQQLKLEELGIDQLGLDLTVNGVTVAPNGEEWLALTWDPDVLLEKVPAMSASFGFPLPAGTEDQLAMVTGLLGGTEISLDAYFAEAPAEGAPVLNLGQPISLAVKEGNLQLQGYDTGFPLGAYLGPYGASIGSLAAAWDGEKGQLRLASQDKALPALVLEDGLVSTVASSMVGDILPWDFVENVLDNTSLSLAFTYEDAAPTDLSALDYEVKPAKSAISFVAPVQVSRVDGKLAIYGESIPLDLLGFDISGLIRSYVSLLGPQIETLDLNLGPGGISLAINDKHLTLAWDATTRANTVDLLFDVGVSAFNLPPIATSGLVKSGVNLLVGAATQVNIGASIELTDQEIQPGDLENLARWLLSFGG